MECRTGDPATGGKQDEERGIPDGLPRGEAARALALRFERFVQHLTPPAGLRSYREFAGWLEDLIGPDPFHLPPEDPASLQVVVRACQGNAALVERDVAALVALKDVLRGLVWAEEALAPAPVEYATFLAELAGAIETSSFALPFPPDRQEILVADVIQARGLPFRAVAVLGLAEGEFPATLAEDPFLHDADRKRLHAEFGLPLEPSTLSAEAEYFYETAARPSERLLLTRPRLADNGAPWQASPYWEEVRRILGVTPDSVTGSRQVEPGEAASWPELLESLATHGDPAAARWAAEEKPVETASVAAAAHVLRQRGPAAGPSPFEGSLTELAGEFAGYFRPERAWSASRLETYRSCPFAFFMTYVLGLEPREEPAEGLDARQLGNIYHHIFERLYRAAKDPADPDALLAALPAVAGAVLDDAPRAEGFRETAWWTQTRAEIAANVERSIVALTALPGDFVPLTQEAAFGGASALTVSGEEDSFRLHGIIDRVDCDPDGRLRIIDYKTGGPSAFGVKDVMEGKKLQLPLYALAAEQALHLGRAADGFYWHVRHAEPSGFSLEKFPGGPAAAIESALSHAWDAVRGARGGRFTPASPDGGCPEYCPAAAFCWRYRPQRGA
jgi:RecB family exonuclease